MRVVLVANDEEHAVAVVAANAKTEIESKSNQIELQKSLVESKVTEIEVKNTVIATLQSTSANTSAQNAELMHKISCLQKENSELSSKVASVFETTLNNLRMDSKELQLRTEVMLLYYLVHI